MNDKQTLLGVGSIESMAIAADVLIIEGQHTQLIELSARLADASASASRMSKTLMRGQLTAEWSEIQMLMAGVRVVNEQLETRYGDAFRLQHEDKELRSLAAHVDAQKRVTV